MQALINFLTVARRWVQELGPYFLLELVLPGGTLLALTLFLYRTGRLDPLKGYAMSISTVFKRL